MSRCMANDTLVRTTDYDYDVLVSALGISSFFEDTRAELNDRMGLFRVVSALDLHDDIKISGRVFVDVRLKVENGD